MTKDICIFKTALKITLGSSGVAILKTKSFVSSTTFVETVS